MAPSRAIARANANIALVKYWGKRDAELNLPAEGSLSLTLEALATETSVEFGQATDSLVLDDKLVSGPALVRLSTWLDRVRALASDVGGARVVSHNNFPTASGLASSASAFAALALAASSAAGLALENRDLSILARLGSGSAARSIHGGLVIMHKGQKTDGSDAFAEPIVSRDELSDWPLAMVIAIVGGGVKKSISSRDAMEHCAETSPLYGGWIDSVAPDLSAARAAIEARDLNVLGDVCEGSALAMHAAAIASRPPIIYFQPATLAVIAAVRELRRASGASAYVTMDAGPHVKILTNRANQDTVRETVMQIEGVTDVIVSGVGCAARVLEA